MCTHVKCIYTWQCHDPVSTLQYSTPFDSSDSSLSGLTVLATGVCQNLSCRPSQSSAVCQEARWQNGVVSDRKLTGLRCDPASPAEAGTLWQGTFLEWMKTKCCVLILWLLVCFFQNFLATSSCPEIQGYLYVKEVGRKSWKKVYMFLRRSGLYCSTKGTSKVLATQSSHLQVNEHLFHVLHLILLCNYIILSLDNSYGYCIKCL